MGGLGEVCRLMRAHKARFRLARPKNLKQCTMCVQQCVHTLMYAQIGIMHLYVGFTSFLIFPPSLSRSLLRYLSHSAPVSLSLPLPLSPPLSLSPVSRSLYPSLLLTLSLSLSPSAAVDLK